MLKHLPIILFSIAVVGTVSAGNKVSMFETDGKLCISSNSFPDHEIGKFPNRGNPHSIREQDIKLCIPNNPVKSEEANYIKGTIGVALNGIQFRPNTAGSYDPLSKSGHSRTGDRRWTLDIFGAKNKLGLDGNNGHVGPNGLYHYHGIAKALITNSDSSLIGYAGDGFEIHYLGNEVVSGYSLRTGNRPSGPGGPYDGTYNEDYIFVPVQGGLDECNGGDLNGKFVYFVTNVYPFVSRCLWGDIADGFGKSGHRR